MLKEELPRHLAGLLRGLGLMGTVRRLLGSQGLIIMLHEVQEDPAAELNTGVPPATLDWMLGWLRREGWSFVSMDTVADRLAAGIAGPDRFVALTFDDGFRDTLTHALPVLERHRAPLACYVPTAAIDRGMYCWWLAARELFRRHDRVEVEALGATYDCPDRARKEQALDAVTRWVHEDYTRAPALAPSFARHGISLPALNERYFMGEAELHGFARHELVTIGGHTTSHTALAVLEREAAAEEIAANRRHLQALLDLPVDHLAYPYGYPKACGAREAELAAAAGYRTAVAALDGPVPSGAADAWALPRVAAPVDIDPAAFDGRVSGLYRAGADMARRLGVLR